MARCFGRSLGRLDSRWHCGLETCFPDPQGRRGENYRRREGRGEVTVRKEEVTMREEVTVREKVTANKEETAAA